MECPVASALLRAWIVHLRAANLSPKTIGNYSGTVERFTTWCEDNGRPTDPAKQTAREVEAWQAELLDAGAADTTVMLRHRSLRQWFGWLLREDEITTNPMTKVSAPKQAERLVPIVSEDDLRHLVDSLDGRDWLDRRDNAIVRLLIDSGMRLGELVGIKVTDVDLERGTVLVHGKGGRDRLAPFGPKTTQALERYMRARSRRPEAGSPWLWLGRRGPISDEGVRAMIRARGDAVGIEGLHPHRFRHSAAHRWLLNGGSERGLMAVAGWRNSAMLGRYGQSAAAERAREEHRRLGLGEGL